MMKPPIENSYWVKSGQFLAGEYPGDRNGSGSKVETLAKAGVTLFIDLTEREIERLIPYEINPAVKGWLNFPIQDVATPTPLKAREILDAIDTAIASGEVVYLHCRGGSGRTGVIVGCWLVRHGKKPSEALWILKKLWSNCPASRFWNAPNTAKQGRFILKWGKGR